MSYPLLIKIDFVLNYGPEQINFEKERKMLHLQIVYFFFNNHELGLVLYSAQGNNTITQD